MNEITRENMDKIRQYVKEYLDANANYEKEMYSMFPNGHPDKNSEEYIEKACRFFALSYLYSQGDMAKKIDCAHRIKNSFDIDITLSTTFLSDAEDIGLDKIDSINSEYETIEKNISKNSEMEAIERNNFTEELRDKTMHFNFQKNKAEDKLMSDHLFDNEGFMADYSKLIEKGDSVYRSSIDNSCQLEFKKINASNPINKVYMNFDFFDDIKNENNIEKYCNYKNAFFKDSFVKTISKKINTLDKLKNSNDLFEQRENAKNRLELYFALKKRGENRTRSEAFWHPFKTRQENKLRDSLKAEIMEKYNFSDDTLDKLQSYCEKGVPNTFLFIRNDGLVVDVKNNKEKLFKILPSILRNEPVDEQLRKQLDKDAQEKIIKDTSNNNEYVSDKTINSPSLNKEKTK